MDAIKIFISSVQREFAEERKNLAEYIRTDALLGRFFSPFIFEGMPAHADSAQNVYLNEVKYCNIYLAIFGESYGYEDEEGVSPTEREYNLATELHKDRLIFIKNADATDRHAKELNLIIRKAEQCIVRKSFGSYEELRSAVYASLVRYLEDNEYLRLLPFDASLHPSATIEDIDESRIDHFVALARKKRAFPLGLEVGTDQILTHLNLMERGRITNAALLLFAKNPQKFFPTSEVKCAQFYTKTISKPIATYQVYQGNMFEVVDNVVSFVMSHIDAKVGERNISAEVDIDFELPIKAVTECIVNAVVHRDYSSNGSVQVMLFPDRLEIWNPGRLPMGITTDDLLLPHSSIPANPVLANVFYLAGYIERMGTGTSDVADECARIGLPAPTFRQEAIFSSTLWRASEKAPSLSPNNTKLDEKKHQAEAEKHQAELEKAPSLNKQSTKLTKKQLLVLEFCKMTPHSTKEILEQLNLKGDTRTRARYTTELVALGLLRPTIDDKVTSPNQKYITTATVD